MIKKMGKKILLVLLSLLLAALPGQGEETQTVQSRLTELGFLSPNNEDVAVAIENFQVANGLELTGGMDQATSDILFGEAAVSQKSFLQALAERYSSQKLSMNSMGEDVEKLQKALGELGYEIGVSDGVYGEATALAVQRFQTANGLYPTGEADAGVLYRLYEGKPVGWEEFLSRQFAKKGDSGQNVRTLQRRLRAIGYFDGECTASFGERTLRAVELFQRDNQLETTGEADRATLTLLFSASPEATKAENVLRLGDTGQQIRVVQTALTELGFYTGTINGNFDERTVTAVILFQIADGLEPDGTVDEALLQEMQAEDAPQIGESVEALENSLAGIGKNDLETVALAAEEMLGKAFAQQGDELFPGFAFVQYVYAVSGMAIYSPGQIMETESLLLSSSAQVRPGEIVAVERAEQSGTRMYFGVGLGEGKIAYVSADTGYVVSQDMAQMDFTGIYAWDFSNGS